MTNHTILRGISEPSGVSESSLAAVNGGLESIMMCDMPEVIVGCVGYGEELEGSQS